MASTPSTNPRRVPLSGHGLTINLRKGATFHSSSDSSPVDNADGTPFFPPSLPRSLSTPDDVIDAYRRRAALTIDSVGELLAAVRISDKPADKTEKNKADKADAKNPLLFDDDCIPRGILDHTIVPEALQPRRIQPARGARRSHDHASDSGLGSSVASSISGKKKAASAPATSPSAAVQAKAITRSAATASEKPAGLSVRASSRIYEHTIRPLLAKAAFKPFHPVLIECASKINKKDIVCLRDLEKTILLLAPVSKPESTEKDSICRLLSMSEAQQRAVYSSFLSSIISPFSSSACGNTHSTKERTSAKLYLDFSLESIRCLQATVDYLSDREQTRPTDAPYTAGYFIDLVEQIHHYAQQLADARDNKKSVSNMDINSSDEIKLHGGITVNGRPAELVRVSADGRAVSIATGLPVELEEDAKDADAIRMKRSASQELEDEEEIMRSMARRKKNAPPEEYAPKMCSVPGCTKEFKRPCDLTKHEKTHSRPWKCVMESCKYHEYGWPTEKERDRHMNDKHSDNPAMYECLFKPCTYKSKRDSNRKQHMEKTHGWKYVRTKTNGTGGKPSGSIVNGQTMATPRPSIDASASSTHQPTPQLVNMPTPASAQSAAVATPPEDFEFNTPLFASGAMGSVTDIEFPTCAPADVLPPPPEMNDMDLMLGEFDNNNLNDASAYASPYSASSSLDNTSAYQDLSADMSTMHEDIYAAHMQLPAFYNNTSTEKATFERFLSLQPDMSVMTPAQQQQLLNLQMQMVQTQQQQLQLQQMQLQQSLPPVPAPVPSSMPQLEAPHFSPLGEGGAMLFTPDSMLDEGFEYADLTKSTFDLSGASSNDFILFPEALASLASSANSSPHSTYVPTTVPTQYAKEVYDYSNVNVDALVDELTPSMAAGYSQPASQVYDLGLY